MEKQKKINKMLSHQIQVAIWSNYANAINATHAAPQREERVRNGRRDKQERSRKRGREKERVGAWEWQMNSARSISIISGGSKRMKPIPADNFGIFLSPLTLLWALPGGGSHISTVYNANNAELCISNRRQMATVELQSQFPALTAIRAIKI